jgi:hypothetical protein
MYNNHDGQPTTSYMKKISEMDEKPHTSSLNKCPKVCPLGFPYLCSGSVDTFIKRRYNRYSLPRCFLHDLQIKIYFERAFLMWFLIIFSIKFLIYDVPLFKIKTGNRTERAERTLQTWFIYTDKKESKIFLICKEIQIGAVAKSNKRRGFLIYGKCANILSWGGR